MMDKLNSGDIKALLNAVYAPMQERCRQLLNALQIALHDHEIKSGFHAGHYFLDAQGAYAYEHFPIPVISISGLCDVEIHVDSTSITSKLRKDQAILYDYTDPTGQRLSVYGVDDYMTDYYRPGKSMVATLADMKDCAEAAFFFTFSFPVNVKAEILLGHIINLKGRGFHY